MKYKNILVLRISVLLKHVVEHFVTKCHTEVHVLFDLYYIYLMRKLETTCTTSNNNLLKKQFV